MCCNCCIHDEWEWVVSWCLFVGLQSFLLWMTFNYLSVGFAGVIDPKVHDTNWRGALLMCHSEKCLVGICTSPELVCCLSIAVLLNRICLYSAELFSILGLIAKYHKWIIFAGLKWIFRSDVIPGCSNSRQCLLWKEIMKWCGTQVQCLETMPDVWAGVRIPKVYLLVGPQLSLIPQREAGTIWFLLGGLHVYFYIGINSKSFLGYCGSG